MDILAVSETFYSIQGEGVSMGMPALFLRLKGCNLTCGGPLALQQKGLSGDATWRCDTIEVWREGSGQTFEQIVDDWHAHGYLAKLKAGAHLVVTGGEPLLQQTALASFFKYLHERVPDLMIEIETNGTVRPSLDLDMYVGQYNVSPKLSNSGMKCDARIVDLALQFFCLSSKAWFKFVLTDAGQFDEVSTDFIEAFGLDKERVFLMPGADNQVDFVRVAPGVVDVCRREVLRFSSRLQVSLYNRRTGI